MKNHNHEKEKRIVQDDGKIVYITAKILDCDIYQTTRSSADANEINRAYEIWHHSESLIHEGASKFELSDGITNLKRCIDHRLKFIESTYRFRTIVSSKQKSGYLELLSELGLVRPFLIKNLFEIRNNIEHHDHNPPEASRCAELLDIAWYLLKSTDSILFNIPEEWELSNPDLPGFDITLRWLHQDEITVFINGWIPIELRSNSDDGKTFVVTCTDIQNKHEGLFRELHSKRSENDIYIVGQISMDSGLSNDLVKLLLF